MQESRLFKIMYHLLDKGQATAPELAEKFEVSVRTIYRDIDAPGSKSLKKSYFSCHTASFPLSNKIQEVESHEKYHKRRAVGFD